MSEDSDSNDEEKIVSCDVKREDELKTYTATFEDGSTEIHREHDKIKQASRYPRWVEAIKYAESSDTSKSNNENKDKDNTSN